MSPALRYFLRRISPFFVVFMLVQLALRLALVVREHANLDNYADMIRPFSLGFIYDVSVFAYFLVPLTLYLLLMPGRLQGGKADRVITSALFGLMAFALLFDSFAEWLFWGEFGTRFNFIAVDYLVYTQEVIGNIRESYPVGLLLAAVAMASALLTFLFRPWRVAVPPVPSRGKRFAAAAGLLALVPLCYFAAPAAGKQFQRNAYVNELGGNGIFSLFAAFWQNELDYDSFYPILAKDEIDRHLYTNLQQADAVFVKESGEDVSHLVRHEGEEKHWNVIVTVMESMSADYMGVFGNEGGYTPNLDRLAGESLFFTNLYATGTRTVRGLEAIALSLPPSPGNSIVRRQGNEGLSSIGYLFRDRGYDTKFIYGGYGYFDNMNYFFGHNGFDTVDRANLGEGEVHFTNAWGVCDEDLFARVIREADVSQERGKPFMSVVMTTSNHRPYTFPDGRIDIPSKSGGRMGGVKYADYAIGRFMEQAREKPWFDHTIFVFVADHTAGSAGKTVLDPAKYHIPAIVYAPTLLKPQQVTQMVSQIDLMPTVLGRLNFTYYSKFYGLDALENDINRAFIASYQYLGYMQDSPENMVILKPSRRAAHLVAKGGPEEQEQEEDAISLYESAAHWKRNMQRIDTVGGPGRRPAG